MVTAELYRNEMAFTYLDGEEIKRYSMSTKNLEFSKFGIEVYFYLDYFKSLTIMFYCMTCCVIPTIYYNCVSTNGVFVQIYINFEYSIIFIFY